MSSYRRASAATSSVTSSKPQDEACKSSRSDRDGLRLRYTDSGVPIYDAFKSAPYIGNSPRSGHLVPAGLLSNTTSLSTSPNGSPRSMSFTDGEMSNVRLPPRHSLTNVLTPPAKHRFSSKPAISSLDERRDNRVIHSSVLPVLLPLAAKEGIVTRFTLNPRQTPSPTHSAQWGRRNSRSAQRTGHNAASGQPRSTYHPFPRFSQPAIRNRIVRKEANDTRRGNLKPHDDTTLDNTQESASDTTNRPRPSTRTVTCDISIPHPNATTTRLYPRQHGAPSPGVEMRPNGDRAARPAVAKRWRWCAGPQKDRESLSRCFVLCPLPRLARSPSRKAFGCAQRMGVPVRS